MFAIYSTKVIDGQIDTNIDSQKDEQIDGFIDEIIDKQTCRQIDVQALKGINALCINHLVGKEGINV